MIKGGLLGLLNTFSSTEMGRFSYFVSSNCTKRNQKLPLLLNELKKHYPLFADSKLTKERLYKKLYRGKAYNDSTMRSLFFHLHQLAEQFLVKERIESNHFAYFNCLIEELNDRAQYNLVEKNIEVFEDQFRSKECKTSNLYFEKYRFENNRFNFLILHNNIKNKTVAEKHLTLLGKSDEFLVVYFVIEIVSDFINSINHKKKYNIDQKEFNFSANIIKTINLDHIIECFPKDSEHFCILDIYNKLFNAYLNLDKVQHYYILKETIENYKSRLNRDELSNLYSILISYCILKNNEESESSKCRDELLDLYRTFLSEEYFKNSKTNFLPPSLYRAILLLGLSFKKYEWVEDFIKTFTLKLQPKDSKNMLHFAQALYFYDLKNPNRALENAKKIKLVNFIYKYDIKNLMLKIYTDTAYHEGVYSLIHTYKEFLQNDSLLVKEGKLFYRTFLEYLEKLILFRDGKTKIEIDYLANEIAKSKDFYNKEWLLLKYRESLNGNVKVVRHLKNEM